MQGVGSGEGCSGEFASTVFHNMEHHTQSSFLWLQSNNSSEPSSQLQSLETYPNWVSSLTIYNLIWFDSPYTQRQISHLLKLLQQRMGYLAWTRYSNIWQFNGRSTMNWVFLPQPTETHRFLFLGTTTEIGISISLFKFQWITNYH